jgi:hypothetical protein
MFSRLTNLTEDVFQIGLMDSFMRSTALLSAKEFSLLEEVLEVFPHLLCRNRRIGGIMARRQSAYRYTINSTFITSKGKG